MSRLTDLIAQAKAKDSQLGADLDREFKVLSSRLPFGLNFERHSPEAVELPLRPIRKGEKVRVLPARGSTKKGDQRLWQVKAIHKAKKLADLELLGTAEAETQTVALEDLVVVAEFRDTIYPGLVSTGKVERGGDKPYHSVINGENYHVLKALTYTHRGKVDAIYIDPPYNTGAKDWKYNNDYVEGDDLYRHSKWLAMMERRLLVAKVLLNPENSVLIVSIDTRRMGLYWNELMRTGPGARREDSPNLFFPIYISLDATRFILVGDPIAIGIDRNTVVHPKGAIARWPIRADGSEGRWRVSAEGVKDLIQKGYIRLGRSRGEDTTIQYISRGEVAKVENGTFHIKSRRPDGSIEVDEVDYTPTVVPGTQWNIRSHDSSVNGALLVRTLLPGRKFPFPKSLYAVEDALRFFVADKPQAIILDFFSGSGTTAHAVMRLNRQDGGRRQCISVTNNEVAADEQKSLREQGRRPGDTDWEKHGICDYITKPRVAAAITGKIPDGQPINGDYKFTDEFPMADGFEENAEFFTLTYEAKDAVNHNLAYARIAPMLWLRAGAHGKRIDKLPADGWAVADTYGLLTEVDKATPFIKAVNKAKELGVAYIVTDDDRRFQAIAKRLPDGVVPVRLYESYLTNFSFANGE